MAVAGRTKGDSDPHGRAEEGRDGGRRRSPDLPARLLGRRGWRSLSGCSGGVRTPPPRPARPSVTAAPRASLRCRAPAVAAGRERARGGRCPPRQVRCPRPRRRERSAGRPQVLRGSAGKVAPPRAAEGEGRDLAPGPGRRRATVRGSPPAAEEAARAPGCGKGRGRAGPRGCATEGRGQVGGGS